MPSGYRWSIGRPCTKMSDCDFGRIPKCLGAALRRLPRSQFGSLTHDLKWLALLPLLSSSTLLTTLPRLSSLSLLLAHTLFIRGLPLTNYGSSQSPRSSLASNLLCNSLLNRERSCLRTRILQSTIQRDEQEASIYESLRELHEITHQ